MTYGAGGSTREKTLETVLDIQQNSSIDACPHLTCVGATNAEILELVEQYKQHGISSLVVLRGDPPSGMVAMGECKYAADLVHLIKQQFNDDFRIAVAAYPEAHPDSKNLATEIDFFSAKMNAGADIAITQYFYNADAYFGFRDDCARAGIDIPITPGVMPITNYRQLARFSQMCGAEIPQWIARRLEGFGEDLEAIHDFGLDVVTRLCERLLDGGAPGLHIYTLNRARAGRELWDRLNPSL